MLSRPLPMLVRLLARSSAGWPPVEVSGPGYRPQVALFAPAAGGCAVLAEDVRFGRVPAHTAVGVEVSDRHRVWSVPVEVPAQIGDGAQVVIPAGSLRVCYVGSPAATGGAAGDGSTVGADAPPAAVGTRLGDGAPGRSRTDTQG